MAHLRQELRDRMQSTLSSGVTLVSGRVYTNRVYSLSAINLPIVTISFDSESSSLATIGIKTMQRNVDVIVDVYCKANANLDDDVDDICLQIEDAIAGDFTLNGLAKQCILTGTDLQLTGDAEQPIGIARLRYSILYFTSDGFLLQEDNSYLWQENGSRLLRA